MFNTQKICLFVFLIFSALLSSCKDPFLWRNDLREFVEDGFSVIFIEDYSFAAEGMQSNMVPSGIQTIVTSNIINPRNLEVDYSLSIESSYDSYFLQEPEIISSGPSQISFSFVPSLSAERKDLLVTVLFSSPQLNREYEPGLITVRCNSAPNPVVTPYALYDGSGKSFVRFYLPSGPSDDDLSLAEITYGPAAGGAPDKTVTLPVSSLGANPEFQPAEASSGVAYRYRLTVIDAEGLRSQTRITANGDVNQVTYNGNGAAGGSVPLDGNFYLEGDPVTVLGNSGGLYITGYSFSGWNTEADGSGETYSPGDSFPMPAAPVTLYALWDLTVYYVYYNENEADGGTPPAPTSGTYNTSQALSYSGTLTRTGYVFSHWNTDPNNTGTTWYPEDSFLFPEGDTTLFAIWIPGQDYDVTDPGPSGGFIFYDKGFYRDGWRFMEAASADLGEYQQWGGYGTSTGALGIGIGSGPENTDLIVSVLGTGFSYPALDVSTLDLGGYSDWFLPSIDELFAMYSNLHLNSAGGFLSERYWSSTEGSSTFARSYLFSLPTGQGYVLAKNQTASSIYVRPARRF